jgi:DNA-binding beta-propeller fold protein YncE
MRSLSAVRLGLLLCAGAGIGCNDGLLPVPDLVYGVESHWPRSSTYSGVGDGRLLVTNSIDDTISLFDLARLGQPDFAELARIPVGLSPVELEGPHHAVIHPGGEYYYINISNYVPGTGGGPHGPRGTGLANGYILKYRASDNELIASQEVDRSPGDVAVSDDGKTLYVSHYDFQKIIDVALIGGPQSDMDTRFLILDAETLAMKAALTLCPGAHGVKLSPDGSRAYVSCISDEIAVVDLVSPDHPVRRIPMAADAGPAIAPKYEPYALTLSPSGDIWVSCRSRNELRVVSAQTLQVDPARIVAVTGAPMFGAFTADGRTLYVPTQIDDAIAVIDAATGVLQREIPVRSASCLNVHQLRITPDGRWGLVVCEGDHGSAGSLLVLDLASGGTVVQAAPVGRFPDSVGVIPGAP